MASSDERASSGGAARPHTPDRVDGRDGQGGHGDRHGGDRSDEVGAAMAREPRATRLDRLDDEEFPALTISQAAELLGVQPAFLRHLDGAGVLRPQRSAGRHRRYSRAQLRLAARIRELSDHGHTLAAAAEIIALRDDLDIAERERDNAREERDQARDELAQAHDDLAQAHRDLYRLHQQASRRNGSAPDGDEGGGRGQRDRTHADG